MNSTVIGVVSGKGGVGKTTTVINVSAALSQMNRSVISIDADVKMAGLGLQLGMYYFPVTLNDVLKDTRNLFQAMYIHSSGLRIIPASTCLKTCNISNLKNILNNSILENHMILVDGPPGLERNALSVMKICQKILIVTEPELPAVSDVMKIIKLSNEMKIKPIGIIINKYRNDKDQISKEEIESVCGLPIIGVVPKDNNVNRSVFRKDPVVFFKPYSPASIAYKKIAATLIGTGYEDKRSIFKKLFGRF